MFSILREGYKKIHSPQSVYWSWCIKYSKCNKDDYTIFI